MFALLVGCHNTGPVKPHVPLVKVEAQPPAAKSLAPVRDLRGKEQAASERVAAKVETVNRQLANTNSKLEAAVLEADRLRKQKTATELELEANWRILTEIRTENLLAKAEVEGAMKEVRERRIIADMLTNKIEELTEAIRKKDSEAEAAQLTIKNSENLRKNSDDNNAKLVEDNKDLAEKLNRALPYKHAVWLIAGAWVLFTIVKIVLASNGIRLPI